MITDGGMFPLEYENTSNYVVTTDYLDEASFASFLNDIDALFEDEDDDVDKGKEGYR